MKKFLCLLLLLLGVASAQGEQSHWTWRQMVRSIDELQSLQSGVAPHRSIVAGVVTQSVSTVSVPASAPTSVAPTTSVQTFSLKSGETMSGRFGKQAQAICAYNQIANCNIVQAGKSYRLLGTVPQATKMQATALPLTAHLSASTAYLDNVFLWERVGGAPLRSCGKQDVATVNEKAWNALIKQGLLTEAERDELRVLTKGLTEPKIGHADNGTVQLTRGMRLESVTFCKDGQPVVRTNVKTAWDFGTAVFAQEFTLKSGKRVLWVRNCLNWSTRSPLPPPVVAEPPVVVPPEAAPTPTPAPPPPAKVVVPTPRPPAEQLACDEWDVRASAGAELSQGAGTRTVALYGDAEVGTCPFKWEDKAGVFNEALIAGRVHAADDAWRGWDGKTVTAMAGFGLRRSFPDGSMDLYRLMAGVRTNNGSQGLYSHDARWKVLGLYGTHYRVEDDGTNETHYRWGLNVHFGQATGSASYSGSSLPLPRYNGSIEVGVRRYVDPQGEDIRRFWELNATMVSPDYAGISPRVGVCNGDDTLCGLVGVNIDVQNGGVAAMVGVQVNTPGVIRYNRDGRIMKDVVEAAKVNGTTFSFAPATKRK
ncbi:MAG: hypothetical protein KBB77_00045 [Candidatus Moranbacteria bacterium]|nr:hypothetical protein [Candidatus Moranbacteria bacterium]